MRAFGLAWARLLGKDFPLGHGLGLHPVEQVGKGGLHVFPYVPGHNEEQHVVSGLLVAMGAEVLLFDPDTGRQEPLATLPQRIEGHRFNDGRCDRQGRFFVGTMHNLTRAPEGTLYRLCLLYTSRCV